MGSVLERADKRWRSLELNEAHWVLRYRDVERANAARFWALSTRKRVGHGLYVRQPSYGPDIPAAFLLSVQHPDVTVCLRSALELHGLRPLSKRELWVARRTTARAPRGLTGVQIQGLQFDARWASLGVETMAFGELRARVTGIARTVADLLAYRARVGTDAAVQALEDVVRLRACCGFELEQMLRARRVHAYARPLLRAAYRRWPEPPVRDGRDFNRFPWLPVPAAAWDALPRGLTFPWSAPGRHAELVERLCAYVVRRPCACRFLPPGVTLDGYPCGCAMPSPERSAA